VARRGAAGIAEPRKLGQDSMASAPDGVA
jgi:hypothetical protein